MKKSKNTPDIGEQSLKARYGKDARNPILWDLINAEFHLKASSKLDPEKPLLDSLIDRADQQGRDSVHWLIRTGFFEAAAKAILKGNAEFFKEVAYLMETRMETPESQIGVAVLRAFTVLKNRFERNKNGLPTKKEVKEMALKSLARQRVLSREPLNGNAKAKMKLELAAKIKKEIPQIPSQNWTAIFKKCGLSHLPKDPGGQPSHKKRPYYT